MDFITPEILDIEAPSGAGGLLGRSSRPPENEKDTLYGRGVANAVGVIGEGKMEGFPSVTVWNGAVVATERRNHIYLNGQQIKYPGDSTPNVKRVKVKYRPGTANQDIFEGFTNTTALDTTVGVIVKRNSGSVDRSFVNNQVDAIQVNIAVRMFKQDQVIKGTELEFEIWVQRNAEGFKRRKVVTLKEVATDYSPLSCQIKTNNQNGTAANWSVRVIKKTVDGDGQKIINDLQWLSYGQVIETKLQYRHTAIIATQLDSETFNSFPDETVDQLGITELLIPAGVGIRADRSLDYGSANWTGALSTAGGCVNDIFPTIINELTNPRINRFPLTLDQIDLADLFEISRWNSQLITHQDGIQRPRFRLCFYLAESRSGFDLLDELCSSCFANYYWADGKLRFWQNRTSLPKTQQFDNSSVLDGVFDYPETPISSRYNVCRVSWWNPETAEEDEELYEDSADVALNGYKETSIVALGCENRYQAWLYAKAVVKTSLLEYRYCNFTASARGAFCRPGQILTIYDENTAQTRNAGLLRAWNGSNVFTLDLPTLASSGDTFRFMAVDGSVQTLTIASVNTSLATITTTANPAIAPYVEGAWAIAGLVVGGEFRVENVEINEEDPDQINISCINNVPNLWDVIENDADPLILKVRGLAPPSVFPVKNLSAALLEVEVSGYDSNPDLYTFWSDWAEPTIDDKPNPFIQSYLAEFRIVPDGEWIQRQAIAKETTEVRWAGLEFGRYQSRVTAIDIYGRIGGWVLSPEVYTSNTGFADTSTFGNIATRILTILRVQNLNNVSIQIVNTGSQLIDGISIFYSGHSFLNFNVGGFINSPDTLNIYTESFAVSDIGSTFNTIQQNNVRMPFGRKEGSNGIPAGQSRRFDVNCAGMESLYIMGRTNTGTTTVKIYYSGKPLAFDYF